MYCKLEIFVPVSHVTEVKEALWSVDAGHIGAYDHCISEAPVTGCFRPLSGTHPYIGETLQDVRTAETKLEVICLTEKLDKTLSAIKQAHPYEEPVINAIPLLATGL